MVKPGRRRNQWRGYNRCEMWMKFRRLVSISLFLFCAWMLAWASLPIKRQVDIQLLQPSLLRVRLNGQEGGPALLNPPQVRLQWPSSLRIGDQAVILLDITSVHQDIPSPEKGIYSDVYDNYNIMLEARFEIVGIRVEPANPVRESLLPGQSVSFRWEITADQAGDNTGNVWLSLRFLPLDGKPPIQEPVFASMLGIHSSSLFGLSGPVARLLGGVGVVLSLLLVFNDMIRWWRKIVTIKHTHDSKEFINNDA